MFKTTVICLRSPPPWVFALHNAPVERWYYMLALYPVISGCLSSKGPISCSAMLSWCKRNQWDIAPQLTSHTSRPCVALLVFDNDWRLVPSPCIRYAGTEWIFLHELTLISQTPWALRVETYPLEQSFTSKTPPPFSCDLLFIYLYWKADISELQTRDTSGSSLWKSQPWKPEKWKANISTSILAGFRPQLISCQSYIFLH